MAIAASFTYLVANGTHFGFVYDDWELLVRRPGWSASAIFDPFHEHVIVAPALLYKLLQQTFGMTSAVPYYVLAMLVFAIAAGLLFTFLRTRVGEWLAFAAILPVLFLGASSEDLLWAFQIGFFGSVAAGLGMLIALDRGGRRADLIAAVLAVVALAFSSVGIPFVIAAVVDVALGPRPIRGRVFVAGIPIAAYAIWWVGWGHAAEHHVSLANLEHLPSYVFDAAGAGFAALFGQQVNSNSDPGHPPLIFRVVAAIAAIGVATRIARDRRLSRGLAVALTIAFAFWILAGIDRDFDRPPISNRYQYPSAVFILLVAGEMFRDVRPSRAVVWASLAVAAFATLGGLHLLQRERRDWNGFANSIRTVLAGVELAGPAARPDFFIEKDDFDATVASFRDAVASYGSPAYDEHEVLDGGSSIGSGVDGTIVEVVGMSLGPGVGPHRARCRRAGAGGSNGLVMKAGSAYLKNLDSGTTGVSVARFGPSPGVPLGTLRTDGTATVHLPRGASRKPWRISGEAGTLMVCEGR